MDDDEMDIEPTRVVGVVDDDEEEPEEDEFWDHEPSKEEIWEVRFRTPPYKIPCNFFALLFHSSSRPKMSRTVS
eukprot:jgi/Psemu1/301986/fgenesh1_kg.54_\